jgi:hypothetical protein
LKSIETSHETADSIVKATCALHNFLVDEAGAPSQMMVDHGLNLEKNGRWRAAGELPQARNIRLPKANHSRTVATDMRNQLKEYFSGEGSVLWQEKMCLLV